MRQLDNDENILADKEENKDKKTNDTNKNDTGHSDCKPVLELF